MCALSPQLFQKRFKKMNTAITVENISKRYRIGVNSAKRYRTLRESITDGLVSRWKRFSAPGQPFASGSPASGTIGRSRTSRSRFNRAKSSELSAAMGPASRPC